MKKKRAKAEKIDVSGSEYFWHVRHWAECSDMSDACEEERGISVGVSLILDKTRELIIDFDFTDYRYIKPNVRTELRSRVISSVKLALESGWDPESRGKPFGFWPPKNTAKSITGRGQKAQ